MFDSEWPKILENSKLNKNKNRPILNKPCISNFFKNQLKMTIKRKTTFFFSLWSWNRRPLNEKLKGRSLLLQHVILYMQPTSLKHLPTSFFFITTTSFFAYIIGGSHIAATTYFMLPKAHFYAKEASLAACVILFYLQRSVSDSVSIAPSSFRSVTPQGSFSFWRSSSDWIPANQEP